MKLPTKNTCRICPNAAVAKGLCATHYKAAREGRLDRPTRVSPGKADSVIVCVNVSRDFRDATKKAAKVAHVSPSEWWRMAAREKLERT